MSNARHRPTVFSLAMAMFGLGLLAVIAVFGLYAAGYSNLPLWLNLATVLTPLGLVTGVVTAVLRARRQTTPGIR